MLIGIAEVVPGVSGGTVALALRIYERLLHSLSAMVGAVMALAGGRSGDARTRAAEAHWNLMLPLFAGAAGAVLVAARVVPPLLERHPEHVRGLFFGLVVASIGIAWRMQHRHRAAHLALIPAAAAPAFLLTGLSADPVVDPALPLVAAAAGVAVVALVLPGVSGSFLLLAMGLYETTLEAVNRLDLGYVLAFATGAAIGLGSVARGLAWLLEHHRDVTLAVLIGLIIGALRAVWPFTGPAGELRPPPGGTHTLEVVLLALVGVLIVVAVFAASSSAERPGA